MDGIKEQAQKAKAIQEQLQNQLANAFLRKQKKAVSDDSESVNSEARAKAKMEKKKRKLEREETVASLPQLPELVSGAITDVNTANEIRLLREKIQKLTKAQGECEKQHDCSHKQLRSI